MQYNSRMFFLFGTKQRQTELPPEHKVCPTCMSVTPHTVIDYDTRFTLYFIPLFSVKREVVYRCTVCGDSHSIPYEEYVLHAAHEAPGGEAPEAAPAGKRRGPTPDSAREKARLILEGRVVNGKAENLRVPFKIAITARHIQIALWIAFAVVAVATAILLAILYSVMAR